MIHDFSLVREGEKHLCSHFLHTTHNVTPVKNFLTLETCQSSSLRIFEKNCGFIIASAICWDSASMLFLKMHSDIMFSAFGMFLLLMNYGNTSVAVVHHQLPLCVPCLPQGTGDNLWSWELPWQCKILDLIFFFSCNGFNNNLANLTCGSNLTKIKNMVWPK